MKKLFKLFYLLRGLRHAIRRSQAYYPLQHRRRPSLAKRLLRRLTRR